MMKIKDMGKKYRIYTEDHTEIWETLNKAGSDIDEKWYMHEVSEGIYQSEDIITGIRGGFYSKLGQKWYEVKGGID